MCLELFLRRPLSHLVNPNGFEKRLERNSDADKLTVYFPPKTTKKREACDSIVRQNEVKVIVRKDEVKVNGRHDGQVWGSPQAGQRKLVGMFPDRPSLRLVFGCGSERARQQARGSAYVPGGTCVNLQSDSRSRFTITPQLS